MSQQDLENAHRAWDAFNRRDLDAALAFMDPEVEFAARFMQIEGRPHLRGHDDIREFWRAVLSVFPDLKVEVLEVRDLGDSMIAALRMSGHGVDSGVAFDEAVWQAAKVRDGRAVWFQTVGSEAEAIEALQAAPAVGVEHRASASDESGSASWTPSSIPSETLCISR